MKAVPQRGKPEPAQFVLAPAPRSIDYGEQWLTAEWVGAMAEILDEDLVALHAVEGGETPSGETLYEVWAGATDSAEPQLRATIDRSAMPHPQGYVLEVAPGGIRVAAHDEAGAFYALQTLVQLLRQSPGALPAVRIEDWPDFPRRGIMLDTSRDKVPTMDTLFDIVDLMAEWKMNELQLYTEHTFAYRGHHVVWEDASPMTAVQVQALEAYCRERFVELVPNQNSFGHFHRWLEHQEYAHLSELPERPVDLCPVDPGSIALLEDLHGQLLPLFDSGMVNVGCDETWTLGKGRSKQAAEERGEGRVYLEFLLQIEKIVSAHGKRMQFWGDIIMKHPELIPELPKDMVPLEWGYGAGHPFREHGKHFDDAGLDFYVCPGTSSWQSIIGNVDNALANLRSAAENGVAYDAMGYLITDWGDHGHFQTLPVSYPGFLYGAGVSWCLEANRDLDLARALNVHVFEDEAGVTGPVLLDLGNAYLKAGMPWRNGNIFSFLLVHLDTDLTERVFQGMTAEGLEQARSEISRAIARLEGQRMDAPDEEILLRELHLGAAMADFACEFGLARLRNGNAAAAGLPANEARPLAETLEPLVAEYRQVWLMRNRSGGLKDSAGRLDKLLTYLKQAAGDSTSG